MCYIIVIFFLHVSEFHVYVFGSVSSMSISKPVYILVFAWESVCSVCVCLHVCVCDCVCMCKCAHVPSFPPVDLGECLTDALRGMMGKWMIWVRRAADHPCVWLAVKSCKHITHVTCRLFIYLTHPSPHLPLCSSGRRCLRWAALHFWSWMVTLNVGVEARLRVLSLKGPLRAVQRWAMALQAIRIAISGFFPPCFWYQCFCRLSLNSFFFFSDVLPQCLHSSSWNLAWHYCNLTELERQSDWVGCGCCCCCCCLSYSI